MKKILSLILIFVISLTICIPTVNADMIPMLPGDFYAENSKDLEYINRDYIADGASGYVTMYESPLDFEIVCYYENGVEINIDYTYEKEGQIWGGNSKGWLLMDNLALIYDSTEFYADHEAGLKTFTDQPYEIPVAMMYAYPNSGDCYEYSENPGYGLFTDCISAVYTDEEGRDWGQILYYLGKRNIWICLSDPTNETLNSGYIAVGASLSKETGEDIMPVSYSEAKQQSKVPIFAIVVVLVVATVAAVLIMKKKK